MEGLPIQPHGDRTSPSVPRTWYLASFSGLACLPSRLAFGVGSTQLALGNQRPICGSWRPCVLPRAHVVAASILECWNGGGIDSRKADLARAYGSNPRPPRQVPKVRYPCRKEVKMRTRLRGSLGCFDFGNLLGQWSELARPPKQRAFDSPLYELAIRQSALRQSSNSSSSQRIQKLPAFFGADYCAKKLFIKVDKTVTS